MRYENDPAHGRHDGDKTLNASNRATESVLAGLAPALGGVDPVAAGFAAGRRTAKLAARRQLFVWRAAAAGLFGAGLSWIVPLTSSTTPVTQTAQHSPVTATVIAAQTPPVVPPVASPQSILMMRRAVTEAGLGGLAVPRLPAPRDVRSDELF